MEIMHTILIVIIVIIGFIFKKKKIKDIKILKISFSIIFIILYVGSILLIEFIIPIPSYYIKAKNETYIENIIEKEMTKSNIEYDSGTLKVVNQFFGKYNQLYFGQYENEGIEEARMFDFKVNIFGNLKPSHDFSESEIISKTKEDDTMNFRRFREGLAAFSISYGYANNPEEFKNYGVNKYNSVDLNPESYYFIVERFDGFEFLYLIVYSLVLLSIIYIKSKKEDKLATYKVTKLEVKGRKIVEFEYFLL